MKYLLFIILFLAIIMLMYSKRIKEGMENAKEREFNKQQEEYYKYREQGTLFDGMEEADKFVQYNPSKPESERLQSIQIDADKINYQPVDNAIEKCKTITSCDELNGTECGYCFKSNQFLYGDEQGPFTDVCPDGWVKTKEDCAKKRERDICKRVTSCHEMTGAASICAWCPVTNKAFAFKTVDGKLIPKYPEDKCEDPDLLTGEQLGLVSQENCSKFGEEHPCVGPNENTGPHSMACLQKLWKEAGGSERGTHAPDKNAAQSAWWNKRGWKAVFNDMKAWVNDANSSNWNWVKTHYKGVYGTDPNPCNSKYNPVPIECYQTLHEQTGCTAKGKLYPSKENIATWPNNFVGKNWTDQIKQGTWAKNSYTNAVNTYKNESHDQTIDYNKRNYAYELCYGGSLSAPPPIKVGDMVKLYITYPGWGDNTELHGYVAEIQGSSAKVFWEQIISADKTKHITRSAHLNAQTSMTEWLGAYAGDVPSKLINIVQPEINVKNLHLMESCKSNTDCNDAGCAMQIIAYVHYPNTNYSVAKNQINDLLYKIRSKMNSAVLCQFADIQFLVNNNLPYCACGWVERDGQYTSVYPSIHGTSGGCGGGQQKVISCGDNGPSWAGGKAGVYVRLTYNPSLVENTLKSIGLDGKVIAVVGKSEYIPNVIIPKEEVITKANGLLTSIYTSNARGDIGRLLGTRVSPQINYPYGVEVSSPHQVYEFYVKFSGKVIHTPTFRTVQFRLGSDDGSRLTINGEFVINMWRLQGYRKQSSNTIPFTSDLPIEVEMYQHYGGRAVTLEWSVNGGSWEIIPSSYFAH